MEINIDNLVVGYNPRKDIGNVSSLLNSIEKNGLQNPLIVRPIRDDSFEVVAGHRRLAACKDLNISKIDCIVKDRTDDEVFHFAFLDNHERENLSMLDEAEHYRKCRERGMKVRETAEKYSVTTAEISRKMSLLDLPEEVLILLPRGKISERHAYEISKLVDKKALVKKFIELTGKSIDEWTEEELQKYSDELGYRQNIQIDLSKRIVDNDLTVKQTERQVKDLRKELKERDDNLDELIDEKKKELEILEGIYFKDASNMVEIKDNAVDLIVTSPPYFVNKEYDESSFDEHLKNIYGVLNECCRVLTPAGKIAIVLGDIVNWSKWSAEGWPEEKLMMHYINDYLRTHGVVLFSRIIWNKDNAWGNSPHVSYHNETRHGEYRVLPNWEYVFVYKNMKGKQRKRRNKSIELKSKISKKDWILWASSVWNISSIQKNSGHPAMFPEELAARIIKMYSSEEDVVLDPFLGSGTTVKVARSLNRVGMGYERNREYEGVILKKLRERNDEPNAS